MRNKNKKKSKYNSSLGEIIDKYSYMDKAAFTLGVKVHISDIIFDTYSSFKGLVIVLLVGLQTILLILGTACMFLPENMQLMCYKFIPTTVVWLILIIVEIVLSKFEKINKQAKLKINDIYDAIDIINKNGDRNIIELIPTEYDDRNNIELCLGDIIYNKAEDNYWIIKKPNDVIKQQYNIDTAISYVLVLGNDYSKGVQYLDDENENIELAYRIGDGAYESSFIALLGGTDSDVIDVITKRN